MVKVGVRKDSVDSTTHRAQFCHARLLNVHSARKVSVAVEQASRAIQCVSRVVNGTTLFGVLVSSAQKDPLLSCRHLRARFRGAFVLQLHRDQIQVHAELTNVLVLPHALVLVLWRLEQSVNVIRRLTHQLLNKLLNSQSALHFLELLVWPLAPVAC